MLYKIDSVFKCESGKNAVNTKWGLCVTTDNNGGSRLILAQREEKEGGICLLDSLY
jgi:hypothetical protein